MKEKYYGYHGRKRKLPRRNKIQNILTDSSQTFSISHNKKPFWKIFPRESGKPPKDYLK